MGMTDTSDFWLRLELVLIKSKIRSLREVCKKVGIPYQTVVNQRCEGRYPSIEVAAKIASEVDCSLDWLVFGKGSYERIVFSGESGR